MSVIADGNLLTLNLSVVVFRVTVKIVGTVEILGVRREV